MKQDELVKQPDDVTEMPYSKLLKKVNTSHNTQVACEKIEAITNRPNELKPFQIVVSGHKMVIDPVQEGTLT